MEINKIKRNETIPKDTPKEPECIEEIIEIPEDSIIIEPEHPPYLSSDGYIYAYIRGKYRKTGMSLKGPKGDKGDAFKFEDFTELQLLTLRGSEGKPGKDGQFTIDEYEKLLKLFPKYLNELKSTPDAQTVNQEEKNSWNSKSDFSGSYNDLSDKPVIPDTSTFYVKPTTGIPETDLSQAVQTSLNKADTAIQAETDPTVPTWAKQPTKPSYTAEEVDALPSDTPLFSGSYNDLTDKPTIPSQVTESTVAGWGFTKNTGTYSKPSTGIPSADLALSVQTSLGKADTALQSFTETDPTVPSWAKQPSKPTYTAQEVGALPSSTVIPAAPGTLNTDNSTAQSVSSSEALSGAVKLHKVSKTGSYNDLLNKPTIPAAQVQSDWNATTGMGVILNKPTIPTVPTNVSAFTNDAGYLTEHQDISGKVDKTTTVNGKALSSNITLSASDVGAQATLTTQTAYTSKGTATKVPQITTNTLGQVTSITEVNISHPDGLTSLNESIANIIDGDEEAIIGYNNEDADVSIVVFQPGGMITIGSVNNGGQGVIQLDGKDIFINAGNLSITISPSGTFINDETVATQEWVVDQGYTGNVGTITGITMNGVNKGTSGEVNLGTVVTDVSGKEDKMGIITVSATSLAPSVNKYYRFTADVGTLAVTLPTVTDTTKVASIVFYLTTGASPAVTFTSSHSVVYQDGFQLDASKTYEINALFNGAAWVLMAAEINTSS